MSFKYARRTDSELEEIAGIVLNRYKHRCSGFFVDIEGIIEDAELKIIPRQGGLRKYVEGYASVDPHYIIVPQEGMTYPPRYRPIIAEEFCHILLEYDFLSKGLPPTAHADALTEQQHKDIEENAHYLKLAILFPKDQFTKEFSECTTRNKNESERDKAIRACGDKLENLFQVWSLMVGYRARDLKLLTDQECRRNFSNRLPM